MSSQSRLFGLLVLALACAPTADTSLTDAERAALRDTIAAKLQQFIAASSEGDADRVASLLSTSSDFAAAGGGQLMTNRDSTIAGIRRSFASMRSQTVDVQQTAIAVLSRDIVVASEQGTVSVTDTMGIVGPSHPIAWTAVWHRVGTEWKAVVYHQSMGEPDTAQASR